jgi:hypothetical protein
MTNEEIKETLDDIERSLARPTEHDIFIEKLMRLQQEEREQLREEIWPSAFRR